MNHQKSIQATLVIAFVIFSLNSNAQNAYYDALKIEYLSSRQHILTKLKAHKADFDSDSLALEIKLESSSAFKMSSIPANTPFIEIIEKYEKNYNAEYKNKKADILALKSSLTKAQEKYVYIIPDIDNFDSFINSPFTSPLNDKNLKTIRKAVVINEEGEIGIDREIPGVSDLQASGMENKGFLSIPVSAQSAIIDGTAKFIAERFKEDITTLYIDKFRKKLDEIKELKGLFPETHSFLNRANVFDYRSLGNDFKEAFEKDLRNVLSNLGAYIENNPNLKQRLENNKLYYPFDFSLQLSDRLIKGDHPVEILDYLEQRYDPSDQNAKIFHGVIRGLNLLQQNLQRKKIVDPLGQSVVLTKPFENIWLSFSDIKKLDTKTEIQYFAALIYHQDSNYFATIRLNAGTDFLKETVYPALEIMNTIENIQSKEKSMSADDYVDLMASTVSLIKHINAKAAPNNKLTNVNFTTANGGVTIDILEFIDSILDLHKSIYSKDYGYIVTNSLFVTEKVLLATGSTQADIIKVTQSVKKYGKFMVDIVTADDSDKVKEAIKRNVTKFSYLDKRNSRFSWTISAHPGVYGGVERLEETDDTNANFGITAPIGFEFMWGIRGKGNNNKLKNKFVQKDGSVRSLSGHSWSIFASFADLGAAFNYRLNDSESELPEELTFKQIFSPGLSLNYGIKNSPITIGVGIQYTPELRKVTMNTIETGSNSLRGMIRLSWDIPLIKICGKTN
ncbi:hypothetical protein FGF1_40460 [Flavobacteriaceae bacterium GF1]